jgi:hypothetical protein
VIETVKKGLGKSGLDGNGGERFACARCGYVRPLKQGEDGFRIYILHEQRCNPVEGQTWLPFITEDDLPLPSGVEKRTTVRATRRQPLADHLNEGRIQGTAALRNRKAA